MPENYTIKSIGVIDKYQNVLIVVASCPQTENISWPCDDLGRLVCVAGLP
jgi:hypothetical protein